MAKDRQQGQGAQAHDAVISIIGSGMSVVGDCETEGTLRVEGRVEGTVRAGKAVVVGREGAVIGDVFTQDAVIGGKVRGTLVAESRLELQETCVVEGEVHARRIQLEEGGTINGSVHTGEVRAPGAQKKLPAGGRAPEGESESAPPEAPAAG